MIVQVKNTCISMHLCGIRMQLNYIYKKVVHIPTCVLQKSKKWIRTAEIAGPNTIYEKPGEFSLPFTVIGTEENNVSSRPFVHLSVTHSLSLCILCRFQLMCVCGIRCILRSTKCYLKIVEQHGANDCLFRVDSQLSAGIFLHHTHQHQGAGAHQLGCKPTQTHKQRSTIKYKALENNIRHKKSVWLYYSAYYASLLMVPLRRALLVFQINVVTG